MAITKSNIITIEGCRYCPMCRHVCPKGFISYKESDTPRGRAILLYDIYKGNKEYDESTIEAVYNCILCGSCWSWCEGREEGGYNIPELIKFARKDIVERKQAPAVIETIKKSLIEKDNPFNTNKTNSLSHSSDEKKADVLYYMGADINFKNHDIAKGVFKIFDRFEISFTILKDEPESGKILEILGYHEDALDKAGQLFRRITGADYKTVVVSDPLVYDSFKNDYPGWGYRFSPDIKVFHISEFLADLIKAGKLKPGKTKEKVTLVDSEYLGRFNRVYDPPREIIKSSAGSNFVEMKWNRDKLLPTGETAFSSSNQLFAFGHILGEKIITMAKEIDAQKIITLSAVAKANIGACTDIEVQDIAEFVASLV